MSRKSKQVEPMPWHSPGAAFLQVRAVVPLISYTVCRGQRKFVFLLINGSIVWFLLYLNTFKQYQTKNWLIKIFWSIKLWGFPGGSVVKNPPANAGDPGLIPGSGRSPGAGNGNPLEYSCLENPMDGRAWQASVHGVTKSHTWLSN